MVAHGTNGALIRRSVLELRNVDGRHFNHDFHIIREAAWLNYKWQNPVTSTVEARTMHGIRVGAYLQ
jgi:hypothetical protein